MSSNGCCAQNVEVETEVLLKESVRKAYADVAVKNTEGIESGITNSCCGAPKQVDVEYSKTLGYSEDDIKTMVEGANMGLGCGKYV